MADGKLAILMPTYRFDATARNNIQTLASMSCDDVQVYIGDNSCNPEKWEFLDRLAATHPNFHAYNHAENLGSNSNWLYLLAQQDHEFACMASDDDFFAPDYFLAGLNELRANSESVMAAGLIVVLTWEQGKLLAHPLLSNEAASAVERVSVAKSLAYSVFRRSCARNFDRYLSERPFHPSYMDQMQTYNLLSQGTYVANANRGIFVYNNTNWTADACFVSDGKFYVADGFPESVTHLHHLNWAVDGMHFFRSSFRPDISEDVAIDVANVVFLQHMATFRDHVHRNLDVFNALFSGQPDAMQALIAILGLSPAQPNGLFVLYFKVLVVFHPELAARYHDFLQRTLLPQYAGQLMNEPGQS